MIANHVPYASLEWARSHGVRIALALLLAVGLSKLADLAARRMRRRLEGAPSVTQEVALQRSATLTQALTSALRIAIWTITALLVLGQLGFELGPLLAGAGIIGVALGFGAQSLARDFLSGFFILLEDQFAVGHVVDVQTAAGLISGTVESLTLRVTAVRAFDGTLHIIPNGNIQWVGNRSRGWARAIVDVRVAVGEDVEAVRRILEDLMVEMADGPLGKSFLSQPRVLGVETLGRDEVVMRVAVETRPGRRADVERELRERIRRRLDERGIRPPLPVGVARDRDRSAS
jgi:small-conductance mechanosensitive channel